MSFSGGICRGSLTIGGMRAAWSLVVVAAGACGRLGFTEAVPGDGAVGSGDGLGGDGATGDAQQVACSQQFDICDGFEDGVDTTLWTLDPGATLDATFAHRGGASIRIHTSAFGANQSNYTSIFESQTLASDPPTFWVRAWFYLSALPAGDNGMELITAERPGDAGDYVFVRRTRTSLYTQYSGDVRTAMAPAPVASWFCAVFEVVRDTGAAGSLGLSGDLPALTLDSTQTDSASAPMQVVTLGAGFSSSNVTDAQPAFDLWIDDVIIHSAPITCSD